MADRGFYGRGQVNHFRYQGPYPRHEIQRARHFFTEQFLYSSSRAFRSLRMKTANCSNFFHRAQINSVISESFGAVQEHTEVNDENSVKADASIDIHTVDGSSDYNSFEQVTIDITNDDTDEPPVKKKKVSNATASFSTTSSHELTHMVDSNGNIQNITSVAATQSYTESQSETSISIEDSSNNNRISNRALVEQGSLSGEEEEDDLVQKEKVLELCLMCDLCQHIVRGFDENSEQKMKSHFSKEQHNAASLVEVEVENGKLIPRYVDEKLCISDRSIKPKIMPVCPECDVIHGSIWTCAMHHQRNHDGNQDSIYGLGKVIEESFIEVSNSHVCDRCKQGFPSASKLHKHWKNQKHFPFKKAVPNQVMHFVCCECEMEGQSFITIRGHVLGSHTLKQKKYKKQNKKAPKMKILYLEKTSKLSTLPQKPKSADLQLSSDKDVFKKSMETMKLCKNQKKQMKKNVLSSETVVHEYTNGERFDKDKQRYYRMIKDIRHYNRYHYKASQIN